MEDIGIRVFADKKQFKKFIKDILQQDNTNEINREMILLVMEDFTNRICEKNRIENIHKTPFNSLVEWNNFWRSYYPEYYKEIEK